MEFDTEELILVTKSMEKLPPVVAKVKLGRMVPRYFRFLNGLTISPMSCTLNFIEYALEQYSD